MTSLINVNKNKNNEVISKHIYGHFTEHLGRCIYEGIWVGEDSHIPNTRGIRNDVVEALKKLQIPNVRWPGGCFADEYHWKDGIGPRDSRPSIVNNNWGGVTENNHFGTHEFMDFCEQIDTEPYISGNVGSGTVQEMQEWVEYITHEGKSPMANLRRKNGRDKPWKLKYFGIGNENWGCGGKMRVEYYADLYRQYQTFVRNYSDTPIYKIAVGASEADYHWTEVMMREGLAKQQPYPDSVVTDIWEHHRPKMHGLSLHFYARNRANYDSATEFDEEKWFDYMKRSLVMEELIERHAAIMDKYDPEKNVGLIIDEWGNWFKVEPGTPYGFLYQQNTLRDAITAGINLNLFNNRCDRIHMANLAQMINVLQSVILTEGEKMILTPTYHVFEMYKVHQDAHLLPVSVSTKDYTYGNESVPKLNVSASKDQSGKVHISVCNLDPNNSEKLAINLNELEGLTTVSGRILTSEKMNDHNSFENPNVLSPVEFNDINLTDNQVSLTIPSKSVVVVEVK